MKSFKEVTGIEFDYFYKNTYNYLYGFLLKMFKNSNIDLDFIINGAYAKLYEKINNFKNDKAELTTYLYAIAKNAAILEYKKKNRIDKLLCDFEYELSISSDFNDKDDIDIDFMYEDVLKEIYERNDIILNYWKEGYKYNIISEKTGVNVSTIKSRIRSFKIKMNKKYGYKNGKK